MDASRRIDRLDRALAALEPLEADCTLCPRECHVDRRRGPAGVCRSGTRAGVSTALLHYGEEPVLSGLPDQAAGAAETAARGSGTVFFTGCNLKCLFCQNYQISWFGRGREISDDELADLFLGLQVEKAYNINLVSPSHLLLPILRALRIAYARGLDLPLVYNTNGYEKVDVIERLAGIVDVYLPDCKYVSPGPALRYSGAADYFARAAAALQEMYVQQPDLVLDSSGIAVRGTIVRHLVLPGQIPNSLAVLEWLAATLSPAVPLSLMSQYRPCHRAPEELRRGLRVEEYQAVLDRARALGFEQLFIQPGLFEDGDHLNPDFDRNDPFPWKSRKD
jgi:putative pyruvate formate lyase activating enzyme